MGSGPATELALDATALDPLTGEGVAETGPEAGWSDGRALMGRFCGPRVRLGNAPPGCDRLFNTQSGLSGSG